MFEKVSLARHGGPGSVMKRYLNFVQKSLKLVLDPDQRSEIKSQKRVLGIIFLDMKAILEKEPY